MIPPSLLLLGGQVRRNHRSLVGFYTEEELRQTRVDKLFLGSSGVRPDGSVTDTTTIEVPVKRLMLAAADTTVLLVDAASFRAPAWLGCAVRKTSISS